MKSLPTTFAFVLMLQLAECAMAASSPYEMVAGKAEVVKIETRPWTVRAHSPDQLVAEGKLVVTLRITEPEAYRASTRTLGVQEEAELKIGGRMLTAGDVISFEAMRLVFEHNIEPDMLSNLKKITIIAKNGPKKSAGKKE